METNECLGRERGLKAQHWGPSVNKVNELYWLLRKFSYNYMRARYTVTTDPCARTVTTLSVWESHEHALACKADPSYPTILQEREALATEPIYEVHVRFSGNPVRGIQSPVTEVDFYKTTDERVDPGATPAAETQEMIRRVVYRIETLQSPGFIAISWGVSLEDPTRGVSITGWRSVEVRFFFLFRASSFRFPLLAKQ